MAFILQKARLFLSFFIVVTFSQTYANNGYDLWLQYKKTENNNLLSHYKSTVKSIVVFGTSKTIEISARELKKGLSGMLGQTIPKTSNIESDNVIVISSLSNLEKNFLPLIENDFVNLPDEGFLIKSVKYRNKNLTLIISKNDIGVLYGSFAFLRLLQTNQRIDNLNIKDAPRLKHRLLNHWDNPDRTVERGYAGFSIWNWHKLPEYIDQRYIDYARANASVGINGTVLTNVNANALILTPEYLEKVEALANVFRPYGIKVYLTARFSAPIQIGKLETADPLDEKVQQWWKNKAKEIYERIPDFGGFLVKANSEGQPGPQNYRRNHVDGANMLADAVAPYGGIVMWRAFVYSEHDPTDRAKQAYSEFVPYDGQFRNNVMVQVKNGAIDFQPREPFHPMFGAMPHTPLTMEFQITQEYLGFSTHLVYLPKLYEEVLQADTYAQGKGSTVAKVIDGSLHNNSLTGMAGVSNIGNDINWTGHHFAQANWYGYGRLAWNPYLSAEKIAEEWIRCTFSNSEEFVDTIKRMMIKSRETVVNYMTPYGLHHIMGTGHHYGPAPWVSNLPRPEWNPVYYHKADGYGIGFNRTKSGSNATSQYFPEVEKMYDKAKTTPEKDLLWFHHLPWDYKLKNELTLWEGIAMKYQQGVNEVYEMLTTWEKMKKYIDNERYNDVKMSLEIQLKEAKWWRDACLLYFQQFSEMPLPDGVHAPNKNLDYYQSLKFPYAPGRG
ncbi:alpha-glucuronidase family glycosyl hydrolase [Abyssalbus ytuae]|uniref:Xylan alpha-1,2-glucuronidase n=1 Tax=Abyssalbus ytuae TaxID=2926907 RepID=A0A9E6ZUD9_9FLAO|nr:alpha-glucuronidase family glycosyl hydrolase [Abyssalbus ytuae]UOB19098.1 alpha-glucuronidase [Abyssalbus ytuae]